MSKKIDVFAHILPPNFLKQIQSEVPDVVEQNPFVKIDSLSDFKLRHENFPDQVQEIISNVNLNPEDYFDADKAVELCRSGNEEMRKIIKDNSDIFLAVVAMLPMNNLSESQKMMEEFRQFNDVVGVQLFTRALGRSIADPQFEPVFAKAAQLNLPIWLHPVFDDNKSDNNITFSWEYELTQSMYQIVKAGYFEKYPDLKIIVHHAGAMIPFFSQRIRYTMTNQEYRDFKKFYVDTAILGNPKALELAASFFGSDHVLFGTDAPFAKMPIGDTEEIVDAIDQMKISDSQKLDIFRNNILKMI